MLKQRISPDFGLLTELYHYDHKALEIQVENIFSGIAGYITTGTIPKDATGVFETVISTTVLAKHLVWKHQTQLLPLFSQYFTKENGIDKSVLLR